jgi:hypothetical protein
MSKKMFKSGGPGYSVKNTRQPDDFDREEHERLRHERIKERAALDTMQFKRFCKAIGRVPNRNDHNILRFNIERRQGKNWWQIARSILGREPELVDEFDDLKPTPDPNRGKNI